MLALHRYMTRQIIVATVFIAAVLLAFVTVVQSLRMVEFVVNRGLPSSVVIELLALRAPSFMGIILPIALFTAILFVYQRLQGESELVIMRSSGLSEFSLALPAVGATLLVMAAAYAIGLYLQPVSFSKFKEREFEYRSAYGSVMLQAGRFNTPTDTLTVYVRERAGARELRGLLIRDSRDPDNPLTILAERGVLSTEGDLPRVVLYEGSRQEIDRETGRLTLLHFNQYSVSFDAGVPVLDNRFRGAKERNLGDLFDPGNTPSELQHRAALMTEGHLRLAEPLNLLAVAFIALAFLLPGQHSRRGSALRLLGAVTTAVAYQALIIGTGSMVGDTLTKASLPPAPPITVGDSLVGASPLYAIPLCVAMIGAGVLVHGLRPRGVKTRATQTPSVGLTAA